jgi:hypothetical protein
MPRSRLIKLEQPVQVEAPHRRRRGEVPHVLHRCHRCRGTGQAACQVCGGSGETVKGRDIFGRIEHSRCCGCFGTKSTRCSACGGTGWT